MRYRLVIFDFDGTLADSFPWFNRVFADLSREFGFNNLPPSEQHRLRAMDTPELLRTLGVPLWKLPAIARRFRQLSARDHATIPLFPGIPQMLAALKASDLQTGIVSSNAESNIRQVLGPALSGQIDRFACGASLLGKVRLLKRLCRQLGLPPCEAIYVGDELRDLSAARGANIHFGAVAWGYTLLSALQEKSPDLVFSDVPSIAAQLCPQSPL